MITLYTVLPTTEMQSMWIQRLPAFTVFFNDSPNWHQKINLRHLVLLRSSPPIVVYDTTNKCWWFATKKEAKNVQDHIASFPMDKLKNHHLLLFNSSSMQDATEHCIIQSWLVIRWGWSSVLQTHLSTLQISFHWEKERLLLQSTKKLCAWKESLKWTRLRLLK